LMNCFKWSSNRRLIDDLIINQSSVLVNQIMRHVDDLMTSEGVFFGC
jgi:hypothetical protein